MLIYRELKLKCISMLINFLFLSKDVLHNKLKSYKIFYGTHLVDPSTDDLQRKDQNKSEKVHDRHVSLP